MFIIYKMDLDLIWWFRKKKVLIIYCTFVPFNIFPHLNIALYLQNCSIMNNYILFSFRDKGWHASKILATHIYASAVKNIHHLFYRNQGLFHQDWHKRGVYFQTADYAVCFSAFSPFCDCKATFFFPFRLHLFSYYISAINFIMVRISEFFSFFFQKEN